MVAPLWVGSPNYRPQNGISKKFVVLHWIVGPLATTDREFRTRASQVATQYGIEDGTVHQYVAEKDYAFGSGTTYANRYGISIEHSGGEIVNGNRRKPSPATHETSALLLADIARRWGWTRLELGKTVFRHSDFKATLCPGSLDAPLIVARANIHLGKPRQALSVDGILGLEAIRALQRALNVPDDGDIGPVTIRALQLLLRVPVDGILGPVTTRALQNRVNAHPDGVWGPETTRRLQSRLNTGTL